MNAENSKYIIPNLKKSCQILEFITDSKKGFSISEISKELKIPRTSVMRILKTLESEDFVEQVESEYILGKRLLRVALLTLEKTSLRTVAAPYLKELSVLTQETAHLAVLSGNKSLLIDVCDSPNPLRVASRSGTLVDLYCSSTGKVFLAYAIKDVEDFYEDMEFVAHTVNTAIDVARVEQDIGLTRETGYGFDDEEFRMGVRCVAVPIWGLNDKLIGAIGITAGASALTVKKRAVIVRHIKNIADKISNEMKLKI